MATIVFKAKVEPVYNMDETLAYEIVTVPKLARSHCDMDAFRRHPVYGPYANSDLFVLALAKIRRKICGMVSFSLRLDRMPDNVTVDRSGFLAKVSISV